MIISETLGALAAQQLGARTKQTAGVSVMSGSAFIDGCVGGPICANSSGGIYGPSLGAEATPSSNTGLFSIAASVLLVGGLLFLIRKV